MMRDDADDGKLVTTHGYLLVDDTYLKANSA